MKHHFKEGEKEAVAAILNIPVSDLPDILNLGPDEDEEDDDDEDDSEDEEEDDNEDDEEDEDEEDDEEDSDDEEDEDEESKEDLELLRLKEEWQTGGYKEKMPFSEFLQHRGK